jgi:hypothetical protein
MTNKMRRQILTMETVGAAGIVSAVAAGNVELIQDGNAKPIPPRPDPPAHTSTYGITQFQFRTTDLSGVKKELIAKQIPIVWEFENQELGVKFLVIRDLNANLIFFLQPLT